jgi:hypothetical protein
MISVGLCENARAAWFFHDPLEAWRHTHLEHQFDMGKGVETEMLRLIDIRDGLI